MQKIVSLFCRNYETDRLVRDEVVPGAEWVQMGEGVATQKLDGTCCMVRGGELFKRYDAKRGKKPPEGFIPAQEEPDPKTGHWPGWLKVGTGPEDRWFVAGMRESQQSGNLPDGTYELIGERVQGNPERIEGHMLAPHGMLVLEDAPRDFAGLRAYLAERDIEGIVWHHPDGRMAKIKKKDFGLKR